jgi:hypothetical protein
MYSGIMKTSSIQITPELLALIGVASEKGKNRTLRRSSDGRQKGWMSDWGTHHSGVRQKWQIRKNKVLFFNY